MKEWRKKRIEALASLDMDWARKMFPCATNDLVLLIAMHKARAECIDLAPALRTASVEWLRGRGWERLGGGELPTARELPE